MLQSSGRVAVWMAGMVSLGALVLSSGAVGFASTGGNSTSTDTTWNMAVSYVSPQTTAAVAAPSQGLTAMSATGTATAGPAITFSPYVLVTVTPPSTVASTAGYRLTATSALDTALSDAPAVVQMIPDAAGAAPSLDAIVNGQSFSAGTPIPLGTTFATLATVPSVQNAVSLWALALDLPTTTLLNSGSYAGTVTLEAVLEPSS